MRVFSAQSVLVISALASVAYAATRQFDIDILNKVIAPDGFARSCVSLKYGAVLLLDISAIAPGGTFPGPTIITNKGDSVEIATHNKLTDPKMRRSFSIVCTTWLLLCAQ